MRRDLCLLQTHEDAIRWLEEFRHTIHDNQVLKVIELLECADELNETEKLLSECEEEKENLQRQLKAEQKEVKRLKELLYKIYEFSKEA